MPKKSKSGRCPDIKIIKRLLDCYGLEQTLMGIEDYYVDIERTWSDSDMKRTAKQTAQKLRDLQEWWLKRG